MDLSKLNEFIRPDNTLYVALSGGADSMCLAHQLATHPHRDPRIEIMCLHVDHGLDARSSDRAVAARQLAEELGLPCLVETMALDGQGNIEAKAREARYEFFKQQLKAGDVLVTAHHRDDVAETLMLRMLRGAGVAGLSGIEAHQPLGLGCLIRPLLDWSRSQIVDYLNSRQLKWIEDPTNEVLSIDRNFIRHEIMPKLMERFPGAQEALNRSAALNRQGATLLAQTLANTLAQDQRDHQRLCIEQWANKSAYEKGELIRLWCINQRIPPPPGKPLESFVSQIADPSPDRVPTLTWDVGTIYCYGGHLWLSPPQSEADPDAAHTHGHSALRDYAIEWNGADALTLPHGLGTLRLDLTKLTLKAFAKNSAPIVFRVTSHQPNEKIVLGSPGRSHRTRRLLSEAQIPPWQRNSWPRLWWNDTLLACGARWQTAELNQALIWETGCFGAQPASSKIS